MMTPFTLTQDRESEATARRELKGPTFVLDEIIRRANAEQWERIINRTLIEWGSNPASIEDEGLDAPSPRVLQLACEVARTLQQNYQPPPDAVVADGSGGIVFRRFAEPKLTEEIRIWDDGAVEYLLWRGPKIIERRLVRESF